MAEEGSELTQQTTVPHDLIVEILSWLPVKSLMRFRCVSKSWNSLIFDPTFVKLHFQRSSKTTHTLITFSEDLNPDGDLGEEMAIYACAASCSIRLLLENPPSTIDDCFRRFNRTHFFFGACNGLVCLGDSVLEAGHEFDEYRVQFLNPATRLISDVSPPLRVPSCDYRFVPYYMRCGFGYDDGSDTYMAVLMLLDVKAQEMAVRVHCMGDNCWRKTLTLPAFAISHEQVNGQFASGTVNWLALKSLTYDYQWETVTIDQLVIFSYDLKEETYRHLLMPDGLSEVPPFEPYLGVLKGCLCLSHGHGRKHLVVWLMREFGIEKSWIQLMNISYTIGFQPYPVVPLCMSQDEDVLLLADHGAWEFVVYNRRDNRIDSIEFKNCTFSFLSYDYVQSLVLPF